MKNFTLLILISSFLLFSNLKPQIRVSNVFQINMVLHNGVDIPIGREGTPGESIEIKHKNRDANPNFDLYTNTGLIAYPYRINKWVSKQEIRKYLE